MFHITGRGFNYVMRFFCNECLHPSFACGITLHTHKKERFACLLHLLHSPAVRLINSVILQCCCFCNRPMWSLFMIDGCTFLGFKHRGPPFTTIVKIGKARIFYYNFCICLKEERHIHLGWLEDE